MADKKVFDIAHPEQTPALSERPKKVMLSEPKAEDAQAAGAPELATTPDAAPVSRRGMTIKPVSDELKPTEPEELAEPNAGVDEPVADAVTLPLTQPEELAEAEATEEKTEDAEQVATNEPAPDITAGKTETEAADTVEPEETATPIKESFGMTDPGLDDSQRATAAAKETMQDPKIYDTKAYYVPIGKTHHKHGHVAGAVVAGIIAAAAAIGALLYVTQGL